MLFLSHRIYKKYKCRRGRDRMRREVAAVKRLILAGYARYAKLQWIYPRSASSAQGPIVLDYESWRKNDAKKIMHSEERKKSNLKNCRFFTYSLIQSIVPVETRFTWFPDSVWNMPTMSTQVSLELKIRTFRMTAVREGTLRWQRKRLVLQTDLVSSQQATVQTTLYHRCGADGSEGGWEIS